jgi:translation initiation factor IF-3
MAQEADLDLVEVSPQSSPPVAKLMDFGKFKYEAAQKIDGHDYGTKKAQIEKFLKAGDKVKVMVVFRGREQSRPEMGIKLLQKLAEEVAEFGAVESTPSIDGRNMVMVIGPLRNKAEVKTDAKKAADKAAKAEAKAETTEVVVEEAAIETGEK